MARTIYVSGRFRSDEEATVNVLDHGLLYGDGIFEGIRAYNGRVFKLDRHIDRLFESAKALRLDLPLSRHEFEQIVLETCRRNDIIDGYIRLVVTRGVGGLGIDPSSCRNPEVIVIARPIISFYREPRRHQTRDVVAQAALPRHAEPVDQVAELREQRAGAHGGQRSRRRRSAAARRERLRGRGDSRQHLPRHAQVGDATHRHESRRHHPRDRARNRRELGMPYEERPFSLFEVWTAREVFVCGTGAEVVPVLSVDGRTIGSGNIGPTTREIIAAYARLARSTGTPIAAATADLSAACLP